MNAPIAEACVLTTRDERGVATLTLNRPQQFNALSQEMMAALQTEFEAMSDDASVRVVVIGAQGKAFCPGHDLKQMKANPSLEYYQSFFAQCTTLMMTIQRLPRAGNRARARSCDRRRLPARRDVRPRSRIGRREICGVGHQRRSVLLDTRRCVKPQRRSQAGV